MDSEEQRLLKLFGTQASPESADPEEERLLKLFGSQDKPATEGGGFWEATRVPETWRRMKRGAQEVADVLVPPTGEPSPLAGGAVNAPQPTEPQPTGVMAGLRRSGKEAMGLLHGLGEMAMPSNLAGELYATYASKPMARGEDISDARIEAAKAKMGANWEPKNWGKDSSAHMGLTDWDKVLLARANDLQAMPEGPERTDFWVKQAGESGRLIGELAGGGVSAAGLVKSGVRALKGRKLARVGEEAVQARRATGIREHGVNDPIEITPPVQGPQRPIDAPDWTPPAPETISPAPTPTAGLTDRPTLLGPEGRPVQATTRSAEEVATARVPEPEAPRITDQFGNPTSREAVLREEDRLNNLFKQAEPAPAPVVEPARPLRRAGEVAEEATGGRITPKPIEPEMTEGEFWSKAQGEGVRAESDIQRAMREGTGEPLPEGALKPGEEDIFSVPQKDIAAEAERSYTSPGRRALRRPISGGSNGWIDPSGKLTEHSSDVSHNFTAQNMHGIEGASYSQNTADPRGFAVDKAIDAGWVRVSDDPLTVGKGALNLELADNPQSIKNAIRYIEERGRGRKELMIDLLDSKSTAMAGTSKYHNQGPFDRPWKAIEWLKTFLGNEQGAINPSKTGPRTLRELRSQPKAAEAPVAEAAAQPLKSARETAAARTEEIVKRPVNVGSVTNETARRLMRRDNESAVEKVIADAPVGDREPVGINLSTINAPEDVQRVIANVAEGHKELIERARGPKVTDEYLARAAAESGLSPADLMKRNKTNPFTPEEVVRYTQIVKTSAADIRNKLAAVTNATGEGYAAAREELRLAIGRHGMIAGAYARGRAQVGRSLRAFQAIPEDILDDVIPLLAQLAPDEVAVITKVAKRATDNRLWDKIMFTYINALLTSPVTHTVNISSNTITALSTPVEKLFQGKFGEAAYDAIGMYQALKGGAFQAAVRAHGTRIPSAGMERYADRLRELGVKMEQPGQLERGRRAPFQSEGGKKFQEYAGQPGRVLAAEDDFFRSVVASGELYSQGLRQAKKEGITGRKAIDDFVKKFVETDATDEALLKAWNEAKYRTFNQKLGKFGQIMLAARKAEAGESGIRPLEFILPFVTTPTNITKFALERSPLGFAALMFKANRGENLAETLAKPMMGSAGLVMGYLAMYAVDGQITGRGPSDPAKREVWLQNHTPYSLEATVGGKKRTVSFERIEPIATVLGAAADVVQGMREMTEGLDKTDREYADYANVFLKGMASVANNMINKTYFQQLTAITNALAQPDRFFDRLGTSLISAVQPVAGISSLARAVDPYKREVSPLTQPQSEIPFASKGLKPQLDPFGRPEERPGGKSVGGFLQRLASPAQIAEKGNDPLLRQLERDGIGIGKADKMLPSGKRMNEDQYYEYEKRSGQLFHEKLADVIDSPAYQDAETHEERKSAVSAALEAARREAREQLVEDGVLPEEAMEPRRLLGR